MSAEASLNPAPCRGTPSPICRIRSLNHRKIRFCGISRWVLNIILILLITQSTYSTSRTFFFCFFLSSLRKNRGYHVAESPIVSSSPVASKPPRFLKYSVCYTDDDDCWPADNVECKSIKFINIKRYRKIIIFSKDVHAPRVQLHRIDYYYYYYCTRVFAVVDINYY